MKNFIAISTAAIFAASAPAMAQNDGTTTDDGSTKADSPVVVETNAQGKATKVRVDGTIYEVCMNERQDGCINPRAAGLNWGDRPLEYWPGETASS